MSKRIGVPLEFKYNLAMRGWSSILNGFLYVIREKHGAAEALELIERLFKMEDRVKNLTNTVKTIFKIEGNDIETWAQWLETWWEICGIEGTTLERSKTLLRTKITKCPWKTGYKDIDWVLIWFNIVHKTINPKITLERPNGMCAGDQHCEYVWKIEE
jgi:hypothetical protein